MKNLTLSPSLKLPAEAVTQTFAVLGIRGSGKTNTAVCMMEEMLKADQQAIALDPTDAWFGIRSSADGKGEGFKVIIMGGEHGDLPLDGSNGRIMAEFVVETGASVVFSIRHLSIHEQRRFAQDFAERLYDLKGKAENRTPLHIFIDEADEFIPQRIPSGFERMFGAFDRLVRRGRSSGIGLTMISQRPQVLNKDTLSQCEILICHRLLHKLDRKAVKEGWVEGHDIEGKAETFMDSLASLNRGEAWFWSPSWLDLFAKVQVRARETFDSSFTPKAGEKPKQAHTLAPVDLEALKARLSETIEKAKADDPRELRKEIQRLTAELKKAQSAKPRLSDEEIGKIVQQAKREEREHWHHRFMRTAEQMEAVIRTMVGPAEEAPTVRPNRTVTPAAQPKDHASTLRLAQKAVRDSAARISRPPVSGNGNLQKGERKILTVLAQYPSGRTKVQIALLTGYAHSGGGFNNYLGSLRSKGYIEGVEPLKITPHGATALGDYEPLPTGQDLIRYWDSQLGKCERAIFAGLVAAYPHELTKEELAKLTGYEAGGGGFNNAFSRLRTLELISGRGELKAADTLFE